MYFENLRISVDLHQGPHPISENYDDHFFDIDYNFFLDMHLKPNNDDNILSHDYIVNKLFEMLEAYQAEIMEHYPTAFHEEATIESKIFYDGVKIAKFKCTFTGEVRSFKWCVEKNSIISNPARF